MSRAERDAAEILRDVVEQMRRAARETGAPYAEPYTHPALFGTGLGFVLWVNWRSQDSANWLSFRVKASPTPRLVMTMKETRGPFTVFRRETDVEKIDPEKLHETWLWFTDRLRYATEREEREERERCEMREQTEAQKRRSG